MRVIVTRPADDAHETAALLKARGHAAILAPLLGVHYHDGHPLHLDGIQALLFTSVNGVRAFARRTALRHFAVFAVGSQTTRAAQDLGFTDIRNADGNSEDLAAVVRKTATPDKGALLHAAGAEAEGRLAAMLTAAGFTVRTEVLYDVPAATELPPSVRAALESGGADAVLLFSSRSAQVFAECVAKARLAPACESLIGVCISEAAARPLGALPLKEVRIAARPNQMALLDCLG